jgi:P-type Cu2+ transporter
LLIKDGTALERLAVADIVVFDKTGTLTLGVPEAGDLCAHDPKALAVALALAQGSAHPLALSLAVAIRGAGIRPAVITGVTEVPGAGVTGRWQGVTVCLGRADWVGAVASDVTATCLRIGNGTPAAFGFTDQLRPGAAEAVAGLRSLGLRVMLMSGDADAPVAALAAAMGIDDYASRLSPTDKADRIAALSRQGYKVLMIGDGLNDTAALAAAHVSVAPASALDAARAASDMVLLGTDLAPVAEAVRIARLGLRRMRQNIAISIAYNIIAVPFALLGYATPLMSAIAMSLSSITVSLNAMRIR